MVAQPKEPIFRLIVDKLLQSRDCKVEALSHIGDLHALVSKTIRWDEMFIKGLSEVFDAVEAAPDALDEGIAEIASKFAPKNGNGHKENLKSDGA